MKKVFLFACTILPFFGFSQSNTQHTTVKVKLPATENPQSPIKAEKLPPLLVWDNVIYTFKNETEFQDKIKGINADSIESMNVLKGKQATDEFGEKGVNGVIIVKSKKK